MKTLLKGGYIVNSDRKFQSDVLIENNIIKQIGQNIVVSGDTKVIDVSNKLVIPGGIDSSTNFNLSQSHRDILHNESMAALAGGTTTIINLVKEPSGAELVNSIKALQSDLKSKVFCNYGFCVQIDSNDDESPKSMETLARQFGINCFQMTIGHEINANTISILKKCKELQCLIKLRVNDSPYLDAVEEELINSGITGPEGFFQSRCIENEMEQLYRILKLNYVYPCCMIIPQIMNEDVAKIVSKMKMEGRPIFSETIPPAFALSSQKYFSNNWDESASLITDPPVRSEQDAAIIRSIHCGDIDMVASEHTTITNTDRSIGKRDFRNIPHGVSGVEERLSMLWDKGVKTGIINECEFVSATSTNAAKIFNLYPDRGHIAVGSVADIVIWNSGKTRTISTSSQHLQNDTNIFEGMSCQGVPEIVIVNGVVKFQLNEFVGNATGEKIDLKIYCQVVKDKLKRYECLREFGKMGITREINDNIGVPSEIRTVKNLDKVVQKDNITADNKINPLKMQRPLTSGGNRNMQDSSFSLSGSQIDDEKPIRSTIRTNHPPGGKSNLIF